MPSVTDTNLNTFAEDVLDAGQPVLVDFWAPWCGPCRQIEPAVKQLAAERDDLRVVKVNVDDNQALAAQLNVMGIPTLVLFADGREVQRISGAVTKDRIAKAVDAALA